MYVAHPCDPCRIVRDPSIPAKARQAPKGVQSLQAFRVARACGDAALTEAATDPESAQRAKDFFAWVIEEWDEPGDNIYIWDFWQLETEGGLYLLDDYAAGPEDSHPTGDFAADVAPLFAQRIVDVMEGRGDSGSLTGR